MDGTRWNRGKSADREWVLGRVLLTPTPLPVPTLWNLKIYHYPTLSVFHFPSLSLTGPTNCNRAPASGGNRLMWHGLWSPGSNNAQNKRALLHAGLAHTKLHVNFSINLAHTFKMHLDALFLLKYIQVTDCISCSG